MMQYNPSRTPKNGPQTKLKSEPYLATDQQYADNIAGWWCNVQKGQPVLIVGSSVHSGLMHLIAEAARAAGASEVLIDSINEGQQHNRILSSETLDELATPPEILSDYGRRVFDGRGAFIRIVGAEFPTLPTDREDFAKLSSTDLTARVAALQKARGAALKPISTAVGKGLMNRCLVGAPTQGWANAVFPNLAPSVAFAKLRAAIMTSCCMDTPNTFAAFSELDSSLERARAKLQSLEIESLHFVGDGTDLRVGLSHRALWLAGLKHTTDERKLPFYANVPIGEAFTTPDWKKTEGTVRVTRPTIINGTQVDGITLTFENGKVILQKSSAQRGADALFKLLSQRNADKLGEIALVSLDSPVARTGVFFKEILFDEKARAHFAAGDAYKMNIIDNSSLTATDIETLGINDSDVHFDFMASDKSTTVYAKPYTGVEIPVMENGFLVI